MIINMYAYACISNKANHLSVCDTTYRGIDSVFSIIKKKKPNINQTCFITQTLIINDTV